MGGCWRGAGRPGFGVQRVEGPGMKAAGDQMWKESPGNGQRQHGHPVLQPSGTSEAGLDENGQPRYSAPSPNSWPFLSGDPAACDRGSGATSQRLMY